MNFFRTARAPVNIEAVRHTTVIIDFTEKEAVLQVRSDRARFRPYGLYGGMLGQPSANYLNPLWQQLKLTSKPTMMIQKEMLPGANWPAAAVGATCSGSRS